MINEALRVIADALEAGVNAQLEALPLDGTDTRPDPIISVVDETRDDGVAAGRYPEDLPAITVTLDGDANLKGSAMSDNRDGELSIVIRYIQNDTNNAEARQHGYNVLRAIQRTVHNLFDNANTADRTRNGIQVIDCLTLDVVSTFQPINDSMLASAIRLRLFVRDDQP